MFLTVCSFKATVGLWKFQKNRSRPIFVLTVVVLLKTGLDSLRDQRARAKIRTRIGRVRLGNFGKCEPVGGGVVELKIDHGPGYRVYFGQVGTKLVILLCGGDKSSQADDIRRAIEYWEDYKN